VPNPLPAPAPACRAAFQAGLCLLALLVSPGRARAIDSSLSAPHEHNGYVWVEVRLTGIFAPRVRESLGRGMPATLELHAELWRRRRAWFDRLETSYDATLRIRYQVWSDTYRVERYGYGPVEVGTLDSLETVLSRPLALPVGRVGDLVPSSTYYVVTSATLRPLSVEDVEEVEGWLSGEVEAKRHAGLGVITELPRTLFDAVRNFAGFGDQRARAVSDVFSLADLFPGRR